MNKKAFLRIAAASVGVGIMAPLLPLAPYLLVTDELTTVVIILVHLAIGCLLLLRPPKALVTLKQDDARSFAKQILRLVALWGLIDMLPGILPDSTWGRAVMSLARGDQVAPNPESTGLPPVVLLWLTGLPIIVVLLTWTLVRPPKALVNSICRGNGDSPSAATVIRLVAFGGGIRALMALVETMHGHAWGWLWTTREFLLVEGVSVSLHLIVTVFLLCGAPLLADRLARRIAAQEPQSPPGAQF